MGVVNGERFAVMAGAGFDAIMMQEADGGLRCVVLTRYQTGLPAAGGVVGYRCLRLGTVKAPVAVRLVTTDGTVYKTASTVSVRATDTDFSAAAGAEAPAVFSFHAGTAQFRSPRPLSNVACVTVALGPTQFKRFPVPILDDAPITLPFDVDPAKEERAAFERAVLAAASAAADARLAQTVCFGEVLARAKGGRNAAETAALEQSGELARLREQAKTVPGAASADGLFAKIEQNLAALRAYNVQLKGHIDKIEEVVKKENDPAAAARDVQAEALNARIKLLLSGGEVDQALAAYDQLIALVPESAEVKARRAALAAEWKVKDDAHQQARDYLLKTWPAVATIQDFKDSLPLVRKEVDALKKNGDKWAVRKLLVAFSTAGVKLNELVTTLDPASEADKKLLADANAVGKALAALETELRTFLGD